MLTVISENNINIIQFFFLSMTQRSQLKHTQIKFCLWTVQPVIVKYQKSD